MPVRVLDHDTYESAGQPGDVCITTHHGSDAVAGYLMRCPGCGQESALPLGPSPGARWTVTAGDPRTGAGLYGLACVSSAAAGPDSAGPDHWVLIVGYRRHVEAHHLRDDLLVSCSAQHPEGRWVPRSDFLRGWGGFNALWARPS